MGGAAEGWRWWCWQGRRWWRQAVLAARWRWRWREKPGDQRIRGGRQPWSAPRPRLRVERRGGLQAASKPYLPTVETPRCSARASSGGERSDMRWCLSHGHHPHHPRRTPRKHPALPPSTSRRPVRHCSAGVLTSSLPVQFHIIRKSATAIRIHAKNPPRFLFVQLLLEATVA